MFSLFARGGKAPLMPLYPASEAPIRVDEARLAALALALGEIRPSKDPPFRPRRMHRGMLPDVDWSNAVPMPSRRSLLRVIAGAFAARVLPMASMGDTASRAVVDPEAARSLSDVAQAATQPAAPAALAGMAAQPTRRAA